MFEKIILNNVVLYISPRTDQNIIKLSREYRGIPVCKGQ